MKRFLVLVTVFLVPLLLAGVLMEVLLRSIPNDYEKKKAYLEANSEKVNTLILGSSHSFAGLNPLYFSDKAFNASYSSQTLTYDFEILKMYESKFDDLKVVVIPISYFTMFSNLEGGVEGWRVKNYIIYCGMKTSRSFSNHTELFSNNLKVNIKRLKIFYFDGVSNQVSSELGWGESYKSQNATNLVESGKKAAIRQTRDNIHSQKYRDIFIDNLATLNSITKWCEKRSIKLVLFMPPAFQTYRSNLNADQLNTSIKTAEEIALKHDHCVFINMMNDTAFVSGDYFDGDHLSEIGAKKLSMKIDEIVIDGN